MRALIRVAVALCVSPSLHSQAQPASSASAAVSVPFVGCKSEGQAEILEAPKATVKLLPISREDAQVLAYYGSALGLGVLAPRGWYCLGIDGSGGDLFVGPQPIDDRKIYTQENHGFDGPLIELSERHSDQYGDRLDKAQIIARVFPAYKALVADLLDGFDVPASLYPFGPYPTDRLTYKSKAVVEYVTPAQTEGLGTHSTLKKNGSPIEGVAILNGDPPEFNPLVGSASATSCRASARNCSPSRERRLPPPTADKVISRARVLRRVPGWEDSRTLRPSPPHPHLAALRSRATLEDSPDLRRTVLSYGLAPTKPSRTRAIVPSQRSPRLRRD